jgi:hypothetical protein
MDNVFVECKGRFRTRDEVNKYLLVRECNPDVVIIFIFYNPDKPMPGARARKDGTKLSHGEWATANNFPWVHKDDVVDTDIYLYTALQNHLVNIIK